MPGSRNNIGCVQVWARPVRKQISLLLPLALLCVSQDTGLNWPAPPQCPQNVSVDVGKPAPYTYTVLLWGQGLSVSYILRYQTMVEYLSRFYSGGIRVSDKIFTGVLVGCLYNTSWPGLLQYRPHIPRYTQQAGVYNLLVIGSDVF